MKVENQNVGPCRIKLVVRAEADECRADYEKIVTEFMRHGRLPGFRQGKAPRAIVEKKFHEEIAQETRRELISRLHREAIESEKLEVANIVDVTDILFSPTMGISFALVVDVAPEFKLPKYQGIPLTIKDVAVTDQDVVDDLERYRDMFGGFEDGDGAIAAKDMAVVDYTATCDGKPLSEITETAGTLAQADDSWVQASDEGFIPGLGRELVGLGTGDEKEIKIKFPKDFRDEKLRGRQALYRVKVKRVRHHKPLTDDELVKQVGVESLEEMRKRLRENMEQQRTDEEKQRQQTEIEEFLLKKCYFEVPQLRVDQAARGYLRMMIEDVTRQGGGKTYLDENRDKLIENARAMAARQTRLNYIFAAIAKEQEIKVPEEEVPGEMQRVAQAIMQRDPKRRDIKDVYKDLLNSGAVDEIHQNLLNTKVRDWLIGAAKTK